MPSLEPLCHMLLLLKPSREGQERIWERRIQGLLSSHPQKPHSQEDPGPDPDRQLRWRPTGALGGRRLLDSTAEPGGKGSGSSQTLAPLVSYISSFLFPILVTCSSFSAFDKSDSHSSFK